MNRKKIIKVSYTTLSTASDLDTAANSFTDGIIYTLYSDKLNSLKVGFAKNNRILETKLSNQTYILLDRKKGNKKELIVLINTLKELGIRYSDNFSFRFSCSLMRHLSTLGWPIGKSLYKHRKIKKELQCA